MMDRIEPNELHARYSAESDDEAVSHWFDMERDSHWDYSPSYVRWLEAQLLSKPLVKPWDNPVGDVVAKEIGTGVPALDSVFRGGFSGEDIVSGGVKGKELIIVAAGKARTEFLVDAEAAVPELEKKKWRRNALVYFNGGENDPLYAPLVLTNIERYPDGSIKSGWVENGNWDLKIVDGVGQSYNGDSGWGPDKLMHSWKVESVLEKDYESYYRDNEKTEIPF